MIASTHPPPTANADDDPVRTALAVRETVERLERQARALVMRCPRPRPEVEVVLQSTAVRALSIGETYDAGKGSVGAWLAGILPKVVQEESRRSRRQPAQLSDDSDWWESRVPRRPSPEYDPAEIRFVIERHLPKLDARDRAIVKMRDLEERGYDDIARRLGVTPVYARKLHSRAIAELIRIAAGEKGVRS